MRIDLRGNGDASGIVNIQVFYDPDGLEAVGTIPADAMVKIAYLETMDKRGATPHEAVVNFAAVAQRAGDVREKYGYDQLVAVCSQAIK